MVGRNACSGLTQNEGRPYQRFASLTYRIRGWIIYLIKARWVSRVQFCGGTCDNNCSRIDLYHPFHTHHGFHHYGHLLFHGLHVSLHLLLHLFYFLITLALARVR